MIHPVLYVLDLLGADLVKVRSLREKAPDHAVLILYAAFLPCGIRVAVIDVKALPFTPTAFPQFLILQKLAAVVGGDALDPRTASRVRGLM